ncbi:adenosinetriphosphatase [Plasmodium inui San Antonio 1]|uniref:Adenosinetriphosphatase n=1 Tax=Plasmodium inui San Antonio 1 TaxID=1237626 RepID=W7AHA8_9APIC|nr:adenosinetriphosphatase [Plasmodium inui San Antonio 1]EUD64646.1 adenosinetriphosphatase [Plasmodium inui San Antonio 1]
MEGKNMKMDEQTEGMDVETDAKNGKVNEGEKEDVGVQNEDAENDDKDVGGENEYVGGEDEDAGSKNEEVGSENEEVGSEDEDVGSDREETPKEDSRNDHDSSSVIDRNTLWSDLYISRPFLKVLYEDKFNNPTFIQRDVIPLALEGKSILANSETGSGKTLAFVLPILERLLHSPNIKMRSYNQSRICVTKSLILLPTRELALQCYDVVKSMTKYVSITYSLFCGGIDVKQQEYEYKKKKDIFICTPGRILDLLLNSSSDFINYLEVVVFDEADKLLELGFKEECLKVLDVCKFKKQILFFSATLTRDIKDLANFSLKNPIFIQSGVDNRKVDAKGEVIPSCISNKKILKSFKISEKLNQEFVNIVNEKYRRAALLHLCSNVYKNHAIIFFKTKKETHLMYLIFSLFNFKCAELHGSLTQKKRIESILKFKKNEVDFLLCTELASRGLDIDHILYVINYNLPSNVIKYVHRIGRTARIGKDGTASTLYRPNEKTDVKKIIKGLKKSKNTKIFRRNISTDSISHWDNLLRKKKKQINEMIKEEKENKEIDKATKSIKKIKNLIQFKDEIMSRPPREWFLTNKEKLHLRKLNMKSDMSCGESTAGRCGGEGHTTDGSARKKDSDKQRACKKDSDKGSTRKAKRRSQNSDEKNDKSKLKSFRSIIRELKLNVLVNGKRKLDKSKNAKGLRKNLQKNKNGAGVRGGNVGKGIRSGKIGNGAKNGKNPQRSTVQKKGKELKKVIYDLH